MKVIDKRGHDFLPFDNYVFRWMSFNLDCTCIVILNFCSVVNFFSIFFVDIWSLIDVSNIGCTFLFAQRIFTIL